MRAVVSADSPGVEDVRLADLPDPAPGRGEVLIRVGFCGVNYPDVLLLQDKYQVRPPRPFSPGGEVGGEVAATGDGVTGFAAGDRVMARMGFGGMAELVAGAEDRGDKIPGGMPLDDAGALPTTLPDAFLAPGQRAAHPGGVKRPGFRGP